MSWRRFFRRAQWDRERAQEIESYLDIEIAYNVARGMPPAEASAAARRKFGNPTLIREEIYQMNTISWFDSLAQDVRYGARILKTNPGFAVIAILSLALGIGANTAIFQLIEAVHFRSLPVAKPHELAEIKIVGGNGGMGLNSEYGQLTRPMWEEVRREHAAFSGVFAWSKRQSSVGERKDFQPVNGLAVSGEFFRILGVEPWQGRLTLPEDEHSCPANTVIVSHAYWQSKMGGTPINANTRLLVDGESKQVIGVTPPSFFGLVVGDRFDIAFPFCQPKELRRDVFEVIVMGRLRPGWTVAAASSQLASQSPAIMTATEITGYSARTKDRYLKFKLAAYPASSGVSALRREYDRSLWLLLAITGLVLLIACANLANLMLARASARQREIAVRLALGAVRARLVRQMLVESGLLAVIGAALGIGLAAILSRFLVISLSTASSGAVLSIPTDWRVLLFTAASAGVTCLLFGLAPAFRASGTDPVTAMRTGGRGLTSSRDRFFLQRLMVVTQISVSLVLLVAALLLIRSFHNLITLDPGLRQKGVTLAFLGFPKANIPREQLEPFKRELLQDVRAVPGVLNAATTSIVPLIGGSWGHGFTIGSKDGGSNFTWVSPEYFETMRIPLLEGRNFDTSDTATSPKVLVVNQTFVRRFLTGLNPIGQTLRTHPEPGYPAAVFQIVGIMADTKYDNIRSEIPPIAFAPAAQFPATAPWTAIMIYSDQPSAAVSDSVRKRIAQKYPAVVAQFREFEGMVQDRLVRERLMALLSGFFGILAMLLGMIGLYGVISYIVGRRNNEIGIRIALGAERGQVVRMVMREAILLLALGVAFGTVLSLIAGRATTTLLFGLKPHDPATLIIAIVALVAISLAASYIPARRAARLDPITALRCE